MRFLSSLSSLLCAAAITLTAISSSALGVSGAPIIPKKMMMTMAREDLLVPSPSIPPPEKLPSNATARWIYNLTDPNSETVINPFIKNEFVFVPTNISLYTFHLVTGELKWKFTVPAATPTPFVNMTDNGGYLGASDELVFLGTLYAVYAFEIKSGLLVWEYYPTYKNNFRPIATRHNRADYLANSDGTDGRLYITTFNGPLIELDPRTGSFVRNIGTGIAIEHVHRTEGLIFFNSIITYNPPSDVNRYVFAANVITGELIWNISGIYNIEVGLGMVFIRFNNGFNQTMLAVNATNGQKVWANQINGTGATFDDFIVSRSFFTASSMRNDAYPNHLTNYDPYTGEARWHRIIGFFYLLAGEGAVFALGTVTQARAYSAETGNLLWNWDGIGVNDGAVGLNTVVFGTSTQIVALKVW